MRLRLANKAGSALALLSVAIAVAAEPPEGPPVKPSPISAPAAATPAAATPAKAALVQILDDQAHAAYKEGVFTACTIAGVCTVAFSTVPAGHRRVVEHLSCSIYVPTTGALRYVAFLANSFTAPRDFAPFTRSPADAGQYFVNILTLFPFDAGETPLIYAYSNTSPIQDLTCTATGRDTLVP